MFPAGSPEAKRSEARIQRLLNATPEQLVKAAYSSKKNLHMRNILLQSLRYALVQYLDGLKKFSKKLDELDAAKLHRNHRSKEL